jgi:predicted amidophosphoribosyltransferase
VTRACPQCGRPAQPSARFCRACGGRLDLASSDDLLAPRRCGSCETEAVASALFCHRCGSQLEATVATVHQNVESRVSPAEADDAPAQPEAADRGDSSNSPSRPAAGLPPLPAPTASGDSFGGLVTRASKGPTRHADLDVAEPDDRAGAVQARTLAGQRSSSSSGSFSAADSEYAFETAAPEAEERDDSITIVSRSERDPRSPTPPTTHPRCGKCGAGIVGAGRFCRACGARLEPSGDAESDSAERPCPHCQRKIEAWASFCRHCGQALLVSDDASQPSDAHAAAAACAVCGGPGAVVDGICRDCADALPS